MNKILNNSKPYRKFKLPNISLRIKKSILTFIIFALIIFFLGYFNFTTANYVKVLEQNKNTCYEEKQSLNDDLRKCNNNLSGRTSLSAECLKEKSITTSSLNDCEGDLKNIKSQNNECQNNVNACQNNVDDLERQVENLKDVKKDLEDDLDECEDDLNICQDDLTGCESQ